MNSNDIFHSTSSFEFSKEASSADRTVKSHWFRLFLLWWGTSLLGAAVAQCLIYYRNTIIDRSHSKCVSLESLRLIN
ncbi:MAG: hypothetical protein ACTS7D_01655 [Candidatus Hodgkinia cicadicola]